ncbi:hypothetical protein Cgig2_029817 [Carnegiea gigantea]|uniref:Pseudouridine synthase RsuA/RluA-like domain-containing protein n=1 Tax=Carnegiea gigantea TaxID=171969 RepID=A0A9Q1GVY7_9CARY|nr:hypothetical protein Cgig2_029817 [Carnegiea gigantea]
MEVIASNRGFGHEGGEGDRWPQRGREGSGGQEQLTTHHSPLTTHHSHWLGSSLAGCSDWKGWAAGAEERRGLEKGPGHCYAQWNPCLGFAKHLRVQSPSMGEVEIQSGRPHQIRIHLSFIGHPLLGDPLYVAGGQPSCFGSELVDESFAEDGGYQRPAKPVPGDCGYHLHAHEVTLSHPTTNEASSQKFWNWLND